MRRVVVSCAVLLVAATACESGSKAPEAAAWLPGTGPVVAAVRDSGSLELFRVTPGKHELVPAGTPAGPEGAKVISMTLSSGASPAVCAVWEAAAIRTLMCYDAAHPGGYVVPTAPSGPPFSVALSTTGRSIAWAARRTDQRAPDLYYGRLEAGSLRGLTRVPPGPPVDEETAQPVGDLAWSGEDTLLVSWAIDSDVNGALSRVPVATAASRGWDQEPGCRPTTSGRSTAARSPRRPARTS